METSASTSSQISIRERWLTTALLGLGLITFAVDMSNTTLILPQIMIDMRVEIYQLHWVLTASGIARTVTIAATGWLIAQFGPRNLYLLSIGAMAIGSLGSLFAWNWPSLIFFRMLSGAGGGMIPQLSQAIFYQIFPPGQRGMALGFALMGWSIGPAFGPLMGGNLLELASWRVVYVISLLMSGAGLLMAWLWLPSLHRPARRRLDYYGSLTVTIAISALLIALTQGNREGWDSPFILTLFAIAGSALVAFIVIELRHAEPLVELRLFGTIPFVMAMLVMSLTTMTFRGTTPMISIMMQRLLGFEPLLVAWTQMLPNLIYGAAVLMVGRISDRLPTYSLVISGLLLYAGAFWSYSGVSEVTTMGSIMMFLIFRFLAEAGIVSPNNLATLQALPEDKVYMATALSGLLRSISNTVGTAVAAMVWDQRYTHYLAQYAQDTPLDTAGFENAMQTIEQTLQWSGELASQIPAQSMAVMQNRLLAEASTAAWQDYLMFNAVVALACIFPALPFWRRTKYADAPPTPQTEVDVSSGSPASREAIPQARTTS
jgi:EmrB/QacA subfamily drug resistance transporter